MAINNDVIASNLSGQIEIDDLIDALEQKRLEYNDPVLQLEEQTVGNTSYFAITITERTEEENG